MVSSNNYDFSDWRGVVSLRNRNRAEITVFMCEMCEQKPYPSGVFFRGRAKVIRYSVNITFVSQGNSCPGNNRHPSIVKVIHMFF